MSQANDRAGGYVTLHRYIYAPKNLIHLVRAAHRLENLHNLRLAPYKMKQNGMYTHSLNKGYEQYDS